MCANNFFHVSAIVILKFEGRTSSITSPELFKEMLRRSGKCALGICNFKSETFHRSVALQPAYLRTKFFSSPTVKEILICKCISALLQLQKNKKKNAEM
jgi:hypothetical protein